MQSRPHREFQSDFARKYTAVGRAEGEAAALFAVLDARGFAVTDDQRARILACLDVVELERWVRRAVTATSMDDLFG